MADEASGKPFSERMWAFMDAQEKGSSGRNRVEFLRAKNDIQAALDEGWSGRMIWEQLRDEGRIRFGHSAFAKYVRTLIQGKPALGTPRRSEAKSPVVAAPIEDVRPSRPKPTEWYHPSKPDRDSLI